MKKEFTKKELLDAYEMMLLLRRFEEKAGQLYGMGLIAGFCHLYIGQEAVAVGMEHALEEKDVFITSYRDHGLMLVRGSDPRYIMAELMGRETGVSKGKGGSMHVFDLQKGFYGGHGIVGAQVPIGTGIGFAMKYRNPKNKDISVTIFGDGAANQGQVYESFNMAKLWNLPVLYIIENNEYGMGTSVMRASGTEDLYKRGISFDIPSEQVNGMDFFEVYNATKKAADYIRSGKGPFLLEMKTYRYRGHSMSDPALYRTKEEVESYKHRDCIETFKEKMLKMHKISEAEFEERENKVKAVIAETVKFAESSKEPDVSELYTDVISSNAPTA